MARLSKVMEIMSAEQVDSIIIKNPVTISYVTGFTGDSSLLYIDKLKGVLITDGRYIEQAKNEIKIFEVREYSDSIWETVAELAKNSKMVGFDGNFFSYTDIVVLQKFLSDATLKSLNFDNIRMIKDKKELGFLLDAARIADNAFTRILNDIRPGCTERSLAGKLEYYMRAEGSEKISFDTIVASGERSALPHGMPTDRVIENGDFITFDFGAVCHGYHSDITRTVVLGVANSWHKEMYTVVEEAQRLGMKSARTGMKGKDLDAIVRDYISRRGYGKYFVHGLGHGVGLEIHEMPTISRHGETELLAGMVFTIEPGIYIPGKGGVRIEDTVVLTEEGAYALSGIKKQIIEIF